jgi:hypothetical protein
MKTSFGIIEAIHEEASRFYAEHGVAPEAVALSPGSYRRLIELCSQEHRIGNLIIGCAPLRELVTRGGKLRVVIDELLADTVVEIA